MGLGHFPWTWLLKKKVGYATVSGKKRYGEL